MGVGLVRSIVLSWVVENIARNVSAWRGIVVVRHAEGYIAAQASWKEAKREALDQAMTRRGDDVLPVRASARLSARARAG